ncbi:hypothetical protein OAC02_00960 [Candidatus Pelagibacter sp.]|nr:hypothetical protein [Candidatus Pelagibacter sp.]
MYYLGIFGAVGPNPSAALLRNKEIIAFAEEERFTRIKNAPNALPINAIFFCLKQGGITLKDIENISFGWDCPHQYNKVPIFLKKLYKNNKSLINPYNLNLEKRIKLGYDPERIYNELKWAFATKKQKLDKNKIVYYKHHLCHAASTYFASGFKKASILILDGMGEEYTGGLYKGENEKITCLKMFSLPNTLGGFYSTFTDFLGFRANSEEGKLMALAAYGSYSTKIQLKLKKFLRYNNKSGDFQLNPNLRFGGKRSFSPRFSDNFVKIFGRQRQLNEKVTKAHEDLAYNVQWRLEEVVKIIIKNLISKTKIDNVCLAGGVHMNCKLNGMVANLPEVKNIFVQPASSDNGVSLGAAMISASNKIGKFKKMEHCYYGESFTNTQILKSLKESKLKFEKVKNLNKKVALYLSKGKIIGWFQGRSEVGARALGNRSILANPLIKNMKFKVNKEVKHRETWRPFCPSVNDYKYNEYFGSVPDSDFMILAFKIKKKFIKLLPSAVHVDGTARPQVVKKKTNAKYFDLLKEFEKITSHPVLINSSFNIQGEPIVNTPSEAIRCFSGTGIDILAIGDYLITK